MADEENPFEEGKAGASGKRLGPKVFIRLGLMAAVLGIGAAGGYIMGGMFHGPSAAEAKPPAVEEEVFEDKFPPAEAGGEDFKYVEFEPIVVNLNEPRLARYIRATIILAIREKDFEQANERIEKKKKELRNWLTVYFNGQTLDDVRGPRSLNLIRREIMEACNEQLWPKRRPLISQVLFREFAVQ